MLKLQLFSNKEKSFTFCDFNWQKIEQASQIKSDVSFHKYNEIYVWECGFSFGEKIIQSYLLYGEEFTDYLKLGDSSFVLFDAETDTVIAARDFMGNYPLFYYQTAKSFIFTFSMNALIMSKLFELKINYSKVIEFIECDYYSPPNNQTFYRHVYRLLPAYLLQIKHNEIKNNIRYGKFDLLKYQSFSDEQFIDRFQELFVNSVKKNSAAYQKIAATLSGGLDSSSICSVIQSLRIEPIHTFNFKPKTADAQEDEYIEAIQEKWHNTHQTISSTYSDYEATVKIIEQNAQPIFVFNSTIQLDLIDAAQKAGCEVFLSGHWGDQVVGYGNEYIDELADKKDWINLKKVIDQYFQYSLEMVQTKDLQNTETKNIYIKNLLLDKFKKEKKWNKLPETLWVLFRHFDYGFKDIASALRRKMKPKPHIISHHISDVFRAEFLTERKRNTDGPIKFLNVAETVNASPSVNQKRQLANIFKGNQTYGQEEYFEIYRQNSMRSAQPFFDAELLELNLSVPLRIKFGDGQKRGTLRKALKDYLPEKIASRTTKGNFTKHYVDLFKDLWKDFTVRTSENHPIWQIVDKKVIEKNAKILLDDNCTGNRQQLMPTIKRVIILSIWLSYLEKIKR